MTTPARRVFATGSRVRTKFGLGTVTSDYWRHRDRFEVKLDDGSTCDFCAVSLKETQP